jgi:hypothetical protein
MNLSCSSTSPPGTFTRTSQGPENQRFSPLIALMIFGRRTAGKHVASRRRVPVTPERWAENAGCEAVQI